MNTFTIPHDETLEKHIIGVMFYDPELLYQIRGLIQPDWFYYEIHKKITNHVFKLFDQYDETRINYMEMVPFLENEAVNVSYLMDMAQAVATTAGIEFHIARLKALWILRQSIRVGMELTQSTGLNQVNEIYEHVQHCTEKLSLIGESAMDADSLMDVRNVVVEYEQKFNELIKNPTGITGIATGFCDFDSITAGLQCEDLIVIGARPSMGKTAFMTQMADFVTIKSKIPTALFSLEMSREKIVQRMVAQRARINLHKLNRGTLTPEEKNRHDRALDEIRNATLFIDDTAFLTVPQMKTKARKIKRQHGLGLILIDYLGMISPTNQRSNRYEQVSMTTRELKGLAKDLKTPVVCLSQLSRTVESRDDKRPMLSDLRESGEIEQTADIVGFLYREEYYKPDTEKQKRAELNIAKHRNGATGTIHLDYYKEITKFFNRRK